MTYDINNNTDYAKYKYLHILCVFQTSLSFTPLTVIKAHIFVFDFKLCDFMKALVNNIFNVIKRAKENARKTFERRLILVLGEKHLEEIIQSFSEAVRGEKNILVTDRREIATQFTETLEITTLSHKDTKKVLGLTFDNAIIDLIEFPDVISISRTIGSIKGGGIIIMLLPLTYLGSSKYLKKIIPIGVAATPRDLLRRRLLLKAMQNNGVLVYSTYSRKFIKIDGLELSAKTHIYRDLTYPETVNFPRPLYAMCLTSDQIRALQALEKINSTNHVLFTADRGRGKSSVIGIGLTGIAYLDHDYLRILVSSPEKENVYEIFKFLRLSHEKLGINYSFDPNKLSFKSRIINVIYKNPFESLNSDADILVIDEAAGLPFPLLAKFLDKFKKIIFSTTIHGYEGTGRTFSVRFIDLLRKKDPSFQWIRLETPIRYSKYDPIERWLFDTLMLNAEPEKISRESIAGKIDFAYLTENNPMSLIFNDEELKSLFGILVVAHYRNNPNDLLMLSDAPHHKVFSLKLNKKTIVAMQVSLEGGVSDKHLYDFYKESPSGHIIPDRLFKYYGSISFLHYVGWRIVRIATHPNLTRMGLGSRALKMLEEKALSNNVVWIGAGFSAYPELLRFWIKNGFLPVHVSPKLNKKTGEHTVIVVKPLSKEVNEVITNINVNLKRRLLEESSSTYRNLNAASLRLIMKSGSPITDYKLKLDSMSAFRLNLYLREILHFESASDAIDKLVKFYFAKQMKKFNEENEDILVSAVLQRKKVGLNNLLKIRSLLISLWDDINTSI